MIPLEQVKRGVSAYLDREILPHFSGWQRWLYTAGAAAYLSKAEALIDKLNSSEALRVLALTDENRNIDIDAVYTYLRAGAEKEPARINLPGYGAITLTSADLEKLYQSIKNA